jgi:hypothetical protein
MAAVNEVSGAALEKYLVDYVLEKRRSLPKLNNRTSKLTKDLDPKQHPNFIYPLPNPTTAAFDPLKKGINNLKTAQFYLLNSCVVLWAPQIYFNHCNVKVCCPLCKKPAGPHGWSGIRRICGLYGTYYLCGSRFICRDCDGKCNGWQH